VRDLILSDVVTHEPLRDDALEVRVRYRGVALGGTATPTPDGLRVRLDETAAGVAPGQTAALYRDGRLIAAGTIETGA